MSVYALIVAAGRGERLGSERPKQYSLLGGVPMLRHSLARFAAHERVDAVQTVIRPEDHALYEEAAAHLPLLNLVAGGAERRESVRAGLESLIAVADDPDHSLVLIHDAARPFISMDLIGRVIDGLTSAAAVVPVLGVADTLKRGADGWLRETVARDGLYRAQTPQGFHMASLLAAHEAHDGTFVTDDAALMERAGYPVAMIDGEEDAFKITTAQDMDRAAAMIGGMMETRVGQGFDVHRFGTGDHVVLCGVRIPHEHGLEGHSDADVGAHAITDALLGALGAGDIGQLFPSEDPEWAGAASSTFLAAARDRVREAGGEIRHIDLTLICEAPKIGPYRAAMIANIAEEVSIAPERVSVKATTTEGLGHTGRREGMAGQAVATIAVPAGIA